MALDEQQAVDAARRFLTRERRRLPYPVANSAMRSRRVEGATPPKVISDSAPISGEYWELYFLYESLGSRMVDPTGIRVFVDANTGAAAFYNPYG